MTSGRTRQLRRRYLSLGLGELVAAVVFCGVAATAAGPRLDSDADRFACWAALVPLVVILVQAGVYWLIARTWLGGGRMPHGMASIYRCFRAVDGVLLAVGFVGVVAAGPSSPSVLVLALAVWAFGVAEYVNYFVVRLAYPARRWLTEVGRLRTPRLVQDLRASS